jgi:hypothetical protein
MPLSSLQGGHWQRWRLSLPWLGPSEEYRLDKYDHKEDTRISLAFNGKVTAIALALAPHNLRAVALIFLSRFREVRAAIFLRFAMSQLLRAARRYFLFFKYCSGSIGVTLARV